MLAVLSALEVEIKDFKKGMVINQTSSYQCCKFYRGRYRGRECLLALTGMGAKHAGQVTQLILATYPVKAVISTGFGGSLNAKTGVGDIVVYDRLINGDQTEKSGDLKELLSDPELVRAAKLSGGKDFKTITGNGVTISQVCSRPADKARLCRSFKADMVDMESYAIGKAAIEKNLPFVAVRSVFDGSKDDIGLLSKLTNNGKVSARKVCSQLISNPGEIKSLWRFSQNAGMARKNLAIFLAQLIERIKQPGDSYI